MNIGEKLMLKRFSVKNFKNFKEQIVLDFSKIRDYEFNKSLVKNNLINKMLIYGPNNSGKSNLGAAIMDITRHLTDNSSENNLYNRNCYLNGDSTEDYVEFKYDFVINNKDISYYYKKDASSNLLIEELYEDGNLLFKYNYQNDKYENYILEAKTIDISKRTTNMSVLKYIYNNTMNWDTFSTVKLFMEFVNNMLWFRSLRYNEFIGVMANNEDIVDFIINNRLLTDFQKFLNDCGQSYKLCEIDELNRKSIGVKYKNTIAKFEQVMSTGTISLLLFYYWMNRTPNISFVFLDEFDAFYHYNLSVYILKYLNGRDGFQSIVTSHNPFLATNDLMRPDCYLLLKDGKLKSFADSTNKTIRQAHNLEKMMISGEFE